MRLVRRETAKWTAPLAALRARHGLPPAGNPLIEGQYSPHLNLALFSRVMAEPQADWPPRMRVTGFVFYNGPGGAAAGARHLSRGGPAADRVHARLVGGRAPPAASITRVPRRPPVSASAPCCSRAGLPPTVRHACPTACCSWTARRISCCFRARAPSCTRAAPAPRRRRCAPAARCWSCRTATISPTTPFASRASAWRGRSIRSATPPPAWRRSCERLLDDPRYASAPRQPPLSSSGGRRRGGGRGDCRGGLAAVA